MLRQRTRNLQAAIAASDAVATAAAFFATYYGAGFLLSHAFGLKKVLPVGSYIWLLAVSVPLWWVLFGLFGGYDFSPIERPLDRLRRMARPLILGALGIAAAAFFSKQPLFSRRVVGAFLATNIGFILLGRIIALKIASVVYRVQGALRRIVVVGSNEAAREFGEAVRRAGWGLELAGYIAPTADAKLPDTLGTISELPAILDRRSVDDVVLADTAGNLALVQQVIQMCEEVGVCIHIPSRFFSAALSRPHIESFGGIPMLTFTNVPYSPVALGVKRAIDLAGATALIVPASFLMAAFAVMIKMSSRGPVFFHQIRSGLYGRTFCMHKLRTMFVGAEEKRAELDESNEMAGPVFKMRNDPRITKIGRVLRKYSLDELPQLWNVIKGDMSLIGPRPPLPSEVVNYERWQRRRLSMRPGITCIWQVTDRNRATFDQWMEYDLRYIDNWSLWLDFKIALKTIPAIVKGTGV